MIQKPQFEVQCQPTSHPFSTGGMFCLSILCLLGAILQSGCVSSERLKAEKVRALNFQRLLAQEEKRSNTLDAQLAQKDKKITELNTQLKETKAKIGTLESQNRTLTAELNALRKENHPPQERKSAPDSPDLLQDPDTTTDSPPSEPSLSDPFMSDEELLKILE
ncbi:MAG: hypothetical protein F4Z24_09675 [Nitrospira sp. SB0666_bin_27]|nr:hypothetical protein [Nitrospira sp. SB0666_bin_27]MYC26988.1 hypothetical protein [Nitrospira sp. SB0662_bin_26]MYF24877.1 hypothetical protein [Nitrospira sp. SB0678_bin_10]